MATPASDRQSHFRIREHAAGSDLYGFINARGDVVIEPQFTAASSFSEGLAWVRWPNRRAAFIDNTGQIVLPDDKPARQSAFHNTGLNRRFSNGLAVTARASWFSSAIQFGYLDKSGNWAIRPQFETAMDFSEGCAAIALRDKKSQFKFDRWGFVNDAGDVIISPKFAAVHPFSEGLAAVQSGAGWTFVNKQANYQFEGGFLNVDDFHEGVAAVQSREPPNRWGFINTLGEWVIPAVFEHADRFADGLAAVRVRGRFGYIERTGRVVVPEHFFFARRFVDGLAPVTLNADGMSGYIDRIGMLRINTGFSVPHPFQDGLALVSVPSAHAEIWINRSGEIVWRPKHVALHDVTAPAAPQPSPAACPQPTSRSRDGLAPPLHELPQVVTVIGVCFPNLAAARAWSKTLPSSKITGNLKVTGGPTKQGRHQVQILGAIPKPVAVQMLEALVLHGGEIAGIGGHDRN